MATILENEAAWSTTAATNSSVDTGINWAEGQDPATVNNSARGMMAARAKARLDLGGGLAAGGTANALTVVTNEVLSSGHITAGTRLLLRATADNTSTTVTFAPDSLTAANIKRADGSALAVGDIRSGMYLDLVYNSGSSEWRCANIAPTGAGLASFSANKNGVDQAINTGGEKATFTNEVWDTGGFYDAPNSKWTPPAGTAIITAFGQMVINPGVSLYLTLYKNGSVYQVGVITVNGITSGGGFGVTGSWIVQCNGTDYFEIVCVQDSGSGGLLLGASAFFSGSML